MSSSRLLVLVCLALAGCNKNKVPEPEPTSNAAENSGTRAEPATSANEQAAHRAPSAPAGHPAGGGAAATDVEIEWAVPKGWEESPNSSPMRKATYSIPDPAGGKDTAELAVFFFGAQQGGDVKQNITRWIGQFEDVPEGGVVQREQKANGLEQHVVEIQSGTFVNTMMGGGTKPNQGMLGAVVVTPEGNKYFFKMTGPAKTVQSSKDAFDSLLQSTKQKS